MDNVLRSLIPITIAVAIAFVFGRNLQEANLHERYSERTSNVKTEWYIEQGYAFTFRQRLYCVQDAGNYCTMVLSSQSDECNSPMIKIINHGLNFVLPIISAILLQQTFAWLGWLAFRPRVIAIFKTQWRILLGTAIGFGAVPLLILTAAEFLHFLHVSLYDYILIPAGIVQVESPSVLDWSELLPFQTERLVLFPVMLCVVALEFHLIKTHWSQSELRPNVVATLIAAILLMLFWESGRVLNETVSYTNQGNKVVQEVFVNQGFPFPFRHSRVYKEEWDGNWKLTYDPPAPAVTYPLILLLDILIWGGIGLLGFWIAKGSVKKLMSEAAWLGQQEPQRSDNFSKER